MIIARAPLRVSFCGGGSDIPAFYKEYGGCVLSCSLRKYVYIAIHPSFYKQTITLKYSQTEEVNHYDEIQHKYFRIMLKDYDVKGIEIASMADIPAGTGLGSSSAFTVATLQALKAYKHMSYSKYALACEACEVEIDKAHSPIGKQDQFASAFGGLNFISFKKDGRVTIEPILIPGDGEARLQNNVMLFYTGLTHDANKILGEQTRDLKIDPKRIELQKKLCEMTIELRKHLEEGDVDYLGEVLRKSWEIKKSFSKQIANETIDKMYKLAMDAGASGGKLLGAGGGGFMLFYVKPEYQGKVREALKDYHEVEFKIDYEGATVIFGMK